MEVTGQAYFKFLIGTAIGILFIWIGVTGRLGSLLGAMITPGNMVEGTPPSVNGGLEHNDPNAIVVTPGSVLPMTGIGAFAYNAGVTNLNMLTIAIAVAMAESQGKVDAHNPGNGSTDIEDSWGLWQINVLAHPQFDKKQLVTASYNATAMFIVSAGGVNWNPWGTYTDGSYRKYMGQAGQAATTVIATNGRPGQ